MIPCKNCSDRNTYCHSNCEKYREWKSEYEKSKEYTKEKIRKTYSGRIDSIPESYSRRKRKR